MQMPATVVPIAHTSLRHDVTQTLLGHLFRGHFAPGQKLAVQRIATLLNVSATPVRESLVELAGIGMVELLPNRGAIVRPFRRQELRDLCHLRRLLESEAARCAAGRIEPAELHSLREELQALIKLHPSPAWAERTSAANERLHDLISERCGNARLADEINRHRTLFNALREWFYESYLRHGKYARTEENHEHLAIVEALLRRDGEAAARAMSQHLTTAAADYEAVLFAEGQSSQPSATPARKLDLAAKAQ